MTTDGQLRRLLGMLLIAPAVFVAVLIFGATPASAHAALDSTTPAQGSQLAAAPPTVTLVFSEEVGLGDRSLQVTDILGHRVDDGRPQHAGGDSRTVQVGLTPGLGKGSYTVTWRVVSADGHPVSGTFAFGVGVPAGTVQQTASVDPVVGTLRNAVQLLSYVGSALLIGTSAFLFALWPGGLGSRRLRRLTVAGVVVAVVGSFGSLLVEGPYVAGRSIGALTDTGLLVETFGSSYGRPLLLRVLAVALAVPVLGIWPALPDGEDAGAGGVAAVGNGVLLAASFSLTGHAATASPQLLAEAVDGVHLVVAGIWLGGLAVLFLAYLPDAAKAPGALPGDEATVLRRWSRVAAASVALLVATGVYQGWRETGAVDALPGTTYGRLLISKISLFATLLLVALVARSLVVRAARGAGAGTDVFRTVRRLRATIGVETALGVGVLVVTSYLVASPPARTSYGPPFSTSVEGRDVDGTAIRVVVDVAPTRVGPQTLRLHTYAPTGQVLPFASASGELSRDGAEGPVRMTFTPVADGVAVADGVVVPSAGRWTLTVQVLTDGTTDYAATTAYTVR